jgi:hypothetical protein
VSSDIVALETPSEDAVSVKPSPQGSREAVRWLAGVTAALLLIAFLIATVPLVITLPQCLDSSFFDLIARDVLRGQMVYRDYFLHGPPGMLLIQSGVRTLFGWRSETVYCLDFIIIGVSACLLFRFIQQPRIGPARALWALLLVYLFDFSTTAFCHCQPDIWMMVPTFVALYLRQRRTPGDVITLIPPSPPWRGERGTGSIPEGRAGSAIERETGSIGDPESASMPLSREERGNSASAHVLSEANPGGLIEANPIKPKGARFISTMSCYAILEGMCWGVAFTVKPFVVVTVLACWLMAAVRLRAWHSQAQPQGERPSGLLPHLLKDTGWVVLGGIIVGVLCVGWLWKTGNWPYFVEEGLGKWNSDYWRTTAPWQERILPAFTMLWPWGLLHVLAIPLAIASIVRAAAPQLRAAVRFPPSDSLLGAFYLSWLFQANFLQRQLEYHLVPPVIMAIAIIAAIPVLFELAAIGCLWWATNSHPLLNRQALSLWKPCVTQGSSSEIRTLLTHSYPDYADWPALDRIAAYLRTQRIADRELTCYSFTSFPLYLKLDVKPSTRFVMFYSHLKYFPSHKSEIIGDIMKSPQRFMVSDIRMIPNSSLVKELRAKARTRLLTAADFPASFRATWPFCMPVVYQAGDYLVHAVQRSQPHRLFVQ